MDFHTQMGALFIICMGAYQIYFQAKVKERQRRRDAKVDAGLVELRKLYK